MKTTLEMAKEAGLIGKPVFRDFRDGLERFAELVRADERNRTWTQDHWTEYERSIATQEREACAKVCEANDPNDGSGYSMACKALAKLIKVTTHKQQTGKEIKAEFDTFFKAAHGIKENT